MPTHSPVGKPVPAEGVLIAVRDNSGNVKLLQLDALGNIPVSVSGAGSGGTSSNFGSAFPVAGTAVGAKDSAGVNMVPLNLDASGNLKVSGSLSTTPPAAGTPTLTNVTENLAAVTLLAANVNRLGFVIGNDSDGVLDLKFGATPSATSWTYRLLARDKIATADVGVNYTGIITGIWETTPGTSGHNAARITELTS